MVILEYYLCYAPAFFAGALAGGLLVHYIHSNFKAKAHFCSDRFSPHNDSPSYLRKLRM